MPSVTCVGILVADVIVHPVDQWPQRGRLTQVDEITVRSGGLAHTTSVTLAKLGVPTATVGRVGVDSFGTFLIDALRRHGIDVHVRQEETSSTSATVVLLASDGERSFLHLVGASARLVPEDVPDELLHSSKVMHLGGLFVMPGLDGPPAALLLKRARAAGCQTSLDMAWDATGRWMQLLAPCLPHLDVLFGNLDELRHCTGADDPERIAADLRGRGPRIVAVKMGEAGAYVDGEGWRGRVPAFKVTPIDTTGAGDAFCGGFLAGLLAGWAMERITRFANAVGAMCITAVGGATGIGSMAETLRFMEQTPVRP